MVLFFGQLSYAPNREAVRIIRKEIAPRLARAGANVAIVIAGKNAEGLTDAGAHNGVPVRFAGAVPSIAPYINAADVVIVPVTAGGGTRLKVLESIACGTPVVSTTLGAEGIDRAACGELLTVVDGWAAFADALTAPHVKKGNVSSAFLDMYSWASIVSRIEWPA